LHSHDGKAAMPHGRFSGAPRSAMVPVMAADPMPPRAGADRASPAPLDHKTIRMIIVGILLAMLLGALDQTIVATALPTIGRELADVGDLPWVVTAYLLTSTAAVPLYGKLSDIHGRRSMMLIAIGLFMLGSIACALAPNMLVLILMRGLQGLGGGGLISLAQTIVADVVSPKERGRYQGYIAGVFAFSSIGGPVLGGIIAEHLHWSVIFWLNLPLGAVALLMTDRVLRQLPRHERRHRLDVLGAVLMVLATVTLLLALTWGGVDFPWDSPRILGLFAASALLWAGFVWRVATAAEPFLPLSILLNPVVRDAVIAAFFVMGTLIGLSIFVPVYLESVHHLSASASGLILIALMGGVVVGASSTGQIMGRVTHYKRLPLVGLSVTVVMFGLIALFPGSLPLWLLIALLAIGGMGMGSALPVTTVSIQNAVPLHQLGTATGAANFFRSLGSALIVAGFGAIFFTSIGAHGASLHLDTLAADVAKSGGDLAQIFGWVFGAATAGIALGLGFLARMEELPLRSSVKAEPAAAE
jgi:EmrB/QacA subfamily drug resistance transporter